MATGDSRLRCLSGVVTVEPGGRLGNQVFEMASAWALARSFDLRVAVPADILASLATVYNNLSVPALEDEVWWGPCTGSITLPFIFSAAEKLVSPFEKFVAWAKENEQPVVLTKYVVLLSVIVPELEGLKKEFVVRPDIYQLAQTTLHDFRQHMEMKFGSVEVSFVGVHVRRTDYRSHLQIKYNNVTLAGVSYYRHAVQSMRVALEDAGADAIAFVVVSDDPGWCERRLIPALERDLEKGIPSHVFLGARGGAKSPAHDLTVLSSCNHSIISYGTFGLWSALMAGGRIIAYKLGGENIPRLPTLRARYILPNFSVME